MANNDNLHQAKNAKNDEFYTQFNDIQREINAYIEYNPDVFRGKTVLCPCDDPEWSNFTKFFVLNFEYFGLKKLISTSYAIESKRYKSEWQPTLFETSHPQYDEQKSKVRGKIFVLEHDTNGNGRIDLDDLEWRYLEGDGDFRSAEVSALRDEADVIVTNPPFSLFREFLAWIRGGDGGRVVSAAKKQNFSDEVGIGSERVSLSRMDEDTVSQATVLYTRVGTSTPRQEMEEDSPCPLTEGELKGVGGSPVVEDSPYPLKRGTPSKDFTDFNELKGFKGFTGFNDIKDLKNFKGLKFHEAGSSISRSSKLFLIIGNLNAVAYREIFPLFKENKMWMGSSYFNGGAAFFIADPSLYDSTKMSSEKHVCLQDGKFLWRVNGVRWFTNMEHGRRHQPMELVSMEDNLRFSKKMRTMSEYRRYDNYDAIEVPYAELIPIDYDGVMGVPISFMDKYCPEQFEILKCSAYSDIVRHGIGALYVGGRKVYARILIRKRR